MQLSHMAWLFDETRYTDTVNFNRAVAEFNKEMTSDGIHSLVWKPNEIAINRSWVKLVYHAKISSHSDLLPNESLLPKYEMLIGERPVPNLVAVEIVAELFADNGQYFTNLELLMKVHNQQANKPYHYYIQGDIKFDVDHNGLACASSRII